MGIREGAARFLLRTGAVDATLWLRSRMGSPRISVFTHHHVLEPPPGYPFDPAVADATPAEFRRRLEAVARRFNVIGVEELCRALDGAPLPSNPAIVTFDDGYRSCLEVAVPVLRQVGLRAVFFVATSYVEERRLYWWERIAWLVARARSRRLELTYPARLTLDLDAPGAAETLTRVVKNTSGLDLERFLAQVAVAAGVEWNAGIERRLADELIMTWDQVRALRDAGMDVESHSRTHRVLETLAPVELAEELAGSRADLERELGRRVRAIAYPVGRRIAHLPSVRAAIEAAGYQVGFTNVSGTNPMNRRVDRFDLRRFSVDRGMSDAMLLGQMVVPGLAYLERPPAVAGG
jgi:peptidoglycan/xylan/chitin deacetylase (PgdA/CDA1 family)